MVRFRYNSTSDQVIELYGFYSGEFYTSFTKEKGEINYNELKNIVTSEKFTISAIKVLIDEIDKMISKLVEIITDVKREKDP
jgi:hypothetical protein